jgi:hypothetical protein
VPKSFVIVFGIVTASAVFIIAVACIVLAILGVFRWWSIVAGLLASWFLYKVTLEGAADAIKYGAERSEPLYQMLVTRGAFLFDPPAVEVLPPVQTNADLLGALGELMERYPTALLDMTRLPASKQKMKEVIKEVWREQPKIRGALTQAYLGLSQFQDGIGHGVVCVIASFRRG